MDTLTPLSSTSVQGRSRERSGTLGVTTKSGSIPATATTSSPKASFPADGALGIVDSAGKRTDQPVATANNPGGTTRRAHSVAADPELNEVYVPIPATTAGVHQPPSVQIPAKWLRRPIFGTEGRKTTTRGSFVNGARTISRNEC